MVDKGLQSGIGHGVNGVRANQAVNIKRVGIGRVFHAGGSPQQLHAVGAFCGQSGKFRAAEEFFPIIVSGFGQSDGHFALQCFGQGGIQRVVDARQEEAGHHLNAVYRLALGQARFEAAHIGGIGFEGLGARKQQGEVDAEAVGHQLLQRFHAGIGGGHFD